MLFSFLDAPASQFYGKVSYSFYLLHMVGLSLALHIGSLQGWPFCSAILTTILAVLFTTPMAWVSWWSIEKPFVAVRKRLDGQGSPTAFPGQPTGMTDPGSDWPL